MDQNWASVASPSYVYVGIVDRAEFDKLALPVIDHGTTNAARPLLTKTAYHGNDARVSICFQHWYGPTPAEQLLGTVAGRMRGMSTAEAAEHVAKVRAGAVA